MDGQQKVEGNRGLTEAVNSEVAARRTNLDWGDHHNHAQGVTYLDIEHRSSDEHDVYL